MAIPPITYLERGKARFPRAYRGLITLLPIFAGIVVIRSVGYPPELQWPVPDFAVARYDAAWLLLCGACTAMPFWLAKRHPHGWWKALLPALLILGQGTLGLIASYGAFYPTDVAGTGAAVLLGAFFATYALATVPFTGLLALLHRRATSS